MLFAGVDIAKVDHLIGTIDNKGKDRCLISFRSTSEGLDRCSSWARESGRTRIGWPTTRILWKRDRQCVSLILCM